MRINKNMDIRTFARFHPQPEFIEIELHDKFGLRLHACRQDWFSPVSNAQLLMRRTLIW